MAGLSGGLTRSIPVMQTGTLLSDSSSVQVGDGPRFLVVLPGFGDAMFSGRYSSAVGPALVAYFSRYLDEYTVYLIS